MTDQYLPDTFGAMTGALNAGRLIAGQKAAAQKRQQLSALAPQVLSGDPTATAQAYAIDPDTAKAYGEGADRIGLQLHHIANQIVSMQQAGNEQGAAMLYSQAAPMIRQKFPNAPAQYDPVALKPALDAVVAMTAQPADGKLPSSYQEYQLAQNNPGYGQFLSGQEPAQLTSIPVPGGSMTVKWYPRTKRMTDLQDNPVDAQGNPAGGQAPSAPPQAQQGASAYAPAPEVTQGIDMTVNRGADVPQSDEVAMIAAAQNPGTQYVPQANGGALPLGMPTQPPGMVNVANVQPAPQAPSAPQAAPGRVGFKPDKADPSVIGKRMQELQDLRGAGQQFTDADASAYLRDGKFPDSNAVAPGDPTKTGDEYLATLPPGMRNLVKAIANGDKAAPSASSRNPEAQALLQAVYAYDPSANDTNLPARTQTRKDYTSGRSFQNMRALNQVAAHLEQLQGQIGQVAGHEIPVVGSWVNAAENSYAAHSGKIGIINWQSTADAVAHETRALFAGSGGGTLDELQGYLETLSANNSDGQKRAAIQNIARLVKSRIGILADGYSQGMGRTSDPFAVAFPHAAAAIEHLTGDEPAQAAPAQRGPAIGTIEDGHRFKGGNPADPASWEAVR